MNHTRTITMLILAALVTGAIAQPVLNPFMTFNPHKTMVVQLPAGDATTFEGHAVAVNFYVPDMIAFNQGDFGQPVSVPTLPGGTAEHEFVIPDEGYVVPCAAILYKFEVDNRETFAESAKSLARSPLADNVAYKFVEMADVPAPVVEVR